MSQRSFCFILLKDLFCKPYLQKQKKQKYSSLANFKFDIGISKHAWINFTLTAMTLKYSLYNCILYILSTMLDDSEPYLNLLFYQAITLFSLLCGSWCTSVGWGSNDS